MSVAVEGFQASPMFQQISSALKNDNVKESAIKKGNAIFQFDIKNDSKTQQWTLDLKKGECYKGPAATKATIIVSVSDSDFCSLATGKLNGQKAFMSGKLKVKGNMMLATSK